MKKFNLTQVQDLKPAEDKKEEELPDFLKEQEKLFGDGEGAEGEEKKDKKEDEDGFGWGEKSKKKRKGTEKVKRKFTDEPEGTDSKLLVRKTYLKDSVIKKYFR